MIIKNLKKYFSFEVTVLDDKGIKRRFRASNYQVCGAEQTAASSRWLCAQMLPLSSGVCAQHARH
jgi:hypothetical protein